MFCPLCLEHVLEEKYSHGIEVDVCPNCKGVWLDRGELEKLAAQVPAPPPQPPTPAPVPSHLDDRDVHREPRISADTLGAKKPKKKKKKKRKGLGDLLDDVFDDVLDF